MHIYCTTWTNQALAAATVETLFQLATGATRRAKILEWGIAFDGVSGTAEPVDVDVVLQTSAGTASAGVNTPLDAANPAAIGTTQISFTAEPTIGTAFFSRLMVHPQGGLFVVQYPLGREPTLAVSTRLGIRATAAAIVNSSGYVIWEE